MDQDYSNHQKLINLIEDVVEAKLNKMGISSRDWHLGTVDTVVNSKLLKVFVDGSSVSQNVPCNPSVTFTSGMKIWVIFTNGDSKSKFALCPRAV